MILVTTVILCRTRFSPILIHIDGVLCPRLRCTAVPPIARWKMVGSEWERVMMHGSVSRTAWSVSEE